MVCKSCLAEETMILPVSRVCCIAEMDILIAFDSDATTRMFSLFLSKFDLTAEIELSMDVTTVLCSLQWSASGPGNQHMLHVHTKPQLDMGKASQLEGLNSNMKYTIGAVQSTLQPFEVGPVEGI